MAIYWATPPTFAAGQVLSAEQHLNALARNAQVLFDVLNAPQAPFSGVCFWSDSTPGNDSFKQWDGWLRHKANLLYWKITCWEGGSATVKVNGVVVAGCGGSGTFTGTANLGNLGLTYNQFYRVEVTGGNFAVWLLRAYVMAFYEDLPTFANGMVPTAGEWQALSNNYREVYDTIVPPARPAFTVPVTGGSPTPWIGSFQHQCRYLSYNIALKLPGAPDNEYVEGKIYVNDTLIATFRIGDPWGSPPPSPAYSEYVGGVDEHGFIGQLDLESFGLGLVRGDDYRIWVTGERNDWWNGIANVQPWLLYELPAVTPTLAGWTPPPTWAHGDYVYGTTTEQNVLLLKNDQVALRDVASFLGYPVLNERGYGMLHTRRWRWLHYTNEKNDAPELQYVTTELQKITLPTAYENGVQGWKVYDLDSAAGLYPGMTYHVFNVQAIFEDSSA